MAKIPVMIRLEQDEADALKAAAAGQSRSLSYLARVFVVDGLTRVRSAPAGLVRMAADPLPGQAALTDDEDTA